MNIRYLTVLYVNDKKNGDIICKLPLIRFVMLKFRAGLYGDYRLRRFAFVLSILSYEIKDNVEYVSSIGIRVINGQDSVKLSRATSEYLQG